MKPRLLSTIMMFIAVVLLSTTSIHAQEQTRAQKPKPPTPAALEQASAITQY